MKRVMLTVAYDGTAYSGYQIQPNSPTIEGELNRCLKDLLHEEIKVIGGSRTDAEFTHYVMWRSLIPRRGCRERRFPMP